MNMTHLDFCDEICMRRLEIRRYEAAIKLLRAEIAKLEAAELELFKKEEEEGLNDEF